VDIPSSFAITPWRERPALSVLVHAKRKNPLLEGLNSKILDELRRLVPGIEFEPVVTGEPFSQRDVVERLNSRRYLLTLSPTEGFGIVPLEAMAVGATVIGFDGCGGREYMEPGINCNVTRYPDVAGLIDAAEIVLKDESIAEHLASYGRATAARFTRERFERSWIKEIGASLGKF
jgi:glycosyltransferase involved in cell wall biosynthesis